jgi:hypothetical protein
VLEEGGPGEGGAHKGVDGQALLCHQPPLAERLHADPPCTHTNKDGVRRGEEKVQPKTTTKWAGCAQHLCRKGAVADVHEDPTK